MTHSARLLPPVVTKFGYGRTYRDVQLVYSATARCQCGAGLAYPRDASPAGGAWDCSDILTGRAISHGQPGSKRHDGPAPFAFYKVTSERQPSAGLATTRPGGPARMRSRAAREAVLIVVGCLLGIIAAVLLAAAFGGGR